MRLIGGEGKGRRLLDAPVGVRPTSGRAKELLYSIWQMDISGASLLDLFAGTGALALEAVARGAERAVLVEKDRKAQSVIRRNMQNCRFEDRMTLVSGDVLKVLQSAARLSGPFDFIVADPPYADKVFEEVVRLVGEKKLLKEDGEFMFEVAAKTDVEIPAGWRLRDERTVGDTCLLFLNQTA